MINKYLNSYGRLAVSVDDPDPLVRSLMHELAGEVILTYRIGEDENRFQRALRARYEFSKHLPPRGRPGAHIPPYHAPPIVPGPSPIWMPDSPSVDAPDTFIDKPAHERPVHGVLGSQRYAYSGAWWPGAHLGLPNLGRGSVASLAERTGARLVDIVLLLVVLLIPMMIAISLTPDKRLVNVLNVAMIGLTVLYEPITTWVLGGTPGRRILELDVVSEHSLRSASIPKVTVRWILMLAAWPLCFVVGVADIATAGQDPLRRTWHDKLTGTLVLRTGRRR